MEGQRDAKDLASIAEYNEDDCRATLALREWLVEKRPEDAPWAEPREGTRRRVAGKAASARIAPATHQGEEARLCAVVAGELLGITGARRGRRGGGSSSAAKR
jgi:hypothetical protein